MFALEHYVFFYSTMISVPTVRSIRHVLRENRAMQLLIATRNAHKMEEIRAILTLPGFDILAADAVPGVPGVVAVNVTDSTIWPESPIPKGL